MPLKVVSYLIEWCEQTMSGLDNMDADSIFFTLLTLCLFRVIWVGFLLVWFFQCFVFFFKYTVISISCLAIQLKETDIDFMCAIIMCKRAVDVKSRCCFSDPT